MVEIRVGNVQILILGDIPVDVMDQIRETLSYVVPGHKYMPQYIQSQYSNEPWDGTKTVALFIPGGGLKAPTGLLSYVREVLSENGVPYTILDERTPAVLSSGWSTEGLNLRDYQRKPADDGLNIGRGVMQIATGGGKTETSVAMIAEAGASPAIFYVNSCDLLEQTYDRFRKYVRFNGEPAEIGRVGGGHFDIQPITIATVQTAERALTGNYTKYMFDDAVLDDKTRLEDKQRTDFAELIKEAQFVVVDECQHVACDTIQTVLDSSHKARFRFGMSASPWRDDGLDILIEAAFGRKFCSIPASFLIDRGYLLPPIINFNHFRQALGPAANFQAHYTKYVVENEARNHWIAQRAWHYIDRKLPTIVLVKWARHAEILAEMIGEAHCEVLTSSGKKKKTAAKRKEYLDKMRSRDLLCIIATTLLDEGVDVPAASAGIFAGGGKSSTRELQRVGRFIRRDPDDPNKEYGYIEEFHDHSKHLNTHAKLRRMILSTEQRFQIFDNRDTMSL